MIHLLQNIISFWIGSIFRVRHINSNLAIILSICHTGDRIFIDFSDTSLGTKWHILCSVWCRLLDLINTLLSVCSYSLWPESKLAKISGNLITTSLFAWSGTFLLSENLLMDLTLVPSLKVTLILPHKILSAATLGVLCSWHTWLPRGGLVLASSQKFTQLLTAPLPSRTSTGRSGVRELMG